MRRILGTSKLVFW